MGCGLWKTTRTQVSGKLEPTRVLQHSKLQLHPPVSLAFDNFNLRSMVSALHPLPPMAPRIQSNGVKTVHPPEGTVLVHAPRFASITAKPVTLSPADATPYHFECSLLIPQLLYRGPKISRRAAQSVIADDDDASDRRQRSLFNDGVALAISIKRAKLKHSHLLYDCTPPSIGLCLPATLLSGRQESR